MFNIKDINSNFSFQIGMFFNNLYKKNIFLILFIGLLFNACSTADRGCRSGDNFDGNNTEFDSYIPSGSEDYRDKSGRKLSDKNDLIKWQDTGLVTNGENIVIDIVGRWSPWGAGIMKREAVKIDERGKPTVILESIEKKCSKFINKDVLTPSAHVIIGRYISLTEPKTGTETEYPCWISDGIGMYLLIRDTTSDDPNATSFIVKSPNSGTIHLNDKDNQSKARFIINSNGEKVKDGSGNPNIIKKGMEIYGKVYDSFYLDNYGTYQLNFVSGVYKKAKTPMFESCRNYILKPIQDISKKVFLGIVSDSAYKKGVYALLILYITITGLLFLMGVIQVQLGELTLRAFKIGLVLVMLTPNAWNFFYDHLFRLYLDGIDQMTNIIVSSDKYDPNNPMDFMDRITEKILNPIIGDRIVAGFNANLLLGPIFALFMMLIILFFSICVVFCFACYIIGMILLNIATVMFPIFITMILFNVTRQVFQEYINTILGYSFQVVMSFVVLFFMANIIQYEIQRALGFRMCVAPIINLNPFAGTSPDVLNKYKDLDNGEVEINKSGLAIMGWAPGEGGSFATIPGWSMLIPGYNIYELFAKVHYRFRFSEIEQIAVPPTYENVRYRYTSLPFLEPDRNWKSKTVFVNNRPVGMSTPPGYSACMANPTKENCHPDAVFPDGIGQDDHTRIVSMMFKDHSYDFFDFGDLFIIILFMFVLWELCINYIRTISEYIAIGGEGYTMPQGAIGTSIIESFQQYVGYVQKLAQKDGALGFLGKALLIVTTDKGFVISQLTMKTGAKLSDYFSEKLELGKDGKSWQDSDNRFVRAAAQLGGAIYDSVRYESLDSRSVSSQFRDSQREKENMRGLHYFQDSVGAYSYAGAMMDKMGENSLQNLNPFHSNAKKWLGGYEFNPFSSQSEYGFKSTDGVFGRVANAAAGDAINKWSMENGYGKVFEYKEGNLIKDVDGNDVEAKGSALTNVLGAIFTDGSNYKGIANFSFTDYQNAVDRDYENSFKNFDNPEVQNNPQINPANQQQPNANPDPSMSVASDSTVDNTTTTTNLDSGARDEIPSKEAPVFETPIMTQEGSVIGDANNELLVGDATHNAMLNDMIVEQNTISSENYPKDLNSFDNNNYPKDLNPFENNLKEEIKQNVQQDIQQDIHDHNMQQTNFQDESQDNNFFMSKKDIDNLNKSFDDSFQNNNQSIDDFQNNNPFEDKSSAFMDNKVAQDIKQEDVYVEQPKDELSEMFKALSSEGDKDSFSSEDMTKVESHIASVSNDDQSSSSSSSHSDASDIGKNNESNKEVVSEEKDINDAQHNIPNEDKSNPFLDDKDVYDIKQEDVYVEQPKDELSEMFKALSSEGDKDSFSSEDMTKVESHIASVSNDDQSSSSSSSHSDASDIGKNNESNKEVVSEEKDIKSDSKDASKDSPKDLSNGAAKDMAEPEIKNEINNEKPEMKKDNDLSDNSVKEDEKAKLNMMSLNQQIESLDKELNSLYSSNPDDPRIGELEQKIKDLSEKKGLL